MSKTQKETITINADSFTFPSEQKIDEGLERLQEGQIWNHSEGDIIKGFLIEITDIETKKGRKTITSQLGTLLVNDKGEKISFWIKTIIANEFEKQNIQLNDFVLIEFVGRKKNYDLYHIAKII